MFKDFLKTGLNLIFMKITTTTNSYVLLCDIFYTLYPSYPIGGIDIRKRENNKKNITITSENKCYEL